VRKSPTKSKSKLSILCNLLRKRLEGKRKYLSTLTNKICYLETGSFFVVKRKTTRLGEVSERGGSGCVHRKRKGDSKEGEVYRVILWGGAGGGGRKIPAKFDKKKGKKGSVGGVNFKKNRLHQGRGQRGNRRKTRKRGES